MAAVVALRVNTVHMPHQSRQGRLPRVQHQVIVIAHLAVRQDLCVETVYRLRPDLPLEEAIAVVFVDRLAPVTARSDVVHRAEEFDAERACRGGGVWELRDLT